tara:strand:+ start:10714 stop:11442 length:729 start_codon:yes stop_codon:yes gene_type:complete
MSTFAIADDADGTGFTVTTTSFTANATPKYMAFTGALGSTWTSYGSNITGNGTSALDLGVGYFFVYFANASSGAVESPIFYVNSSSSGTSVHYSCLTAVQAKIRSLSLTSIDNSDVIIRKLDSDRGADDGTYDYPMIVISSFGIETLPKGGGTNKRDEVIYPVVVTILAADNQDLVTNQNKYLLWRQKISRAFRNQNLADVDEIYTVTMQPGPITSPQAFWERNLYHSSLIIKCHSREVRGM